MFPGYVLEHSPRNLFCLNFIKFIQQKRDYSQKILVTGPAPNLYDNILLNEENSSYEYHFVKRIMSPKILVIVT
jgi:hypothetical protein